MKSIPRVAVLLPLLLGCATGELNYTAPVAPPTVPNSATLPVPVDTAWVQMVARLGKSFFVINTVDRPNLINISYNGDPEAYVDCGMLQSTVQQTAGGEQRHYEFPASRAYSVYEMVVNKGVYKVTQTMDLEGRMNIVLEAIARDRTRITVNTRYILAKNRSFWPDNPTFASTANESMSFNTGGNGQFPGSGTRCYANGAFESEILEVLTGR